MSRLPEDGAPKVNPNSETGDSIADNETDSSGQPTEGFPPPDTDDVLPNLESAEDQELALADDDDDDDEQLVSQGAVVKRTELQHEDVTSGDETVSIPDDTPSLQVSSHSHSCYEANSNQGSALSSPRSDAFSTISSSSRVSPTSAQRPFERRFQSRLSSSPLNSSRAVSPIPLNTHSRQSSLANITFPGASEQDTSTTPWDVIKWTKLRKLSGQVFSEVGKRNFGRPTCLAISTNIVIGTSRGIVLVFDYQQNPKGAIGLGTKGMDTALYL